MEKREGGKWVVVRQKIGRTISGFHSFSFRSFWHMILTCDVSVPSRRRIMPGRIPMEFMVGWKGQTNNTKKMGEMRRAEGRRQRRDEDLNSSEIPNALEVSERENPRETMTRTENAGRQRTLIISCCWTPPTSHDRH
jgi:hypothetical protein